MLAMLRAREISSVELVDAHLARIEKVSSRLNAVVTLTAEAAQREAAAADRRSGAERRPLEGLPVTIKDSFETAGVRTTGGTKLFEHYVPATDAVAVARLKAAGAVVLVPGGSSGGEAAAIVSGCSPLGLGSDLAGSVRMPAAFCGIAGLKPTLEAVPRTGHMPPGVAAPLPLALMGTVGPMARTVNDLVLGFEVIRGPHPSDPYILPGPAAGPAQPDVRGVRCAFYTSGGPTPVAAPIRNAVERAAKFLAEAGLRLEERVPSGLDTAHDTFLNFVLSDGGMGFRMLAGERYGELRPQLRRVLEMRPMGSAMDLLIEGMKRDVFRTDLAKLLDECPVILAPTMPIPAFRHDHDGHDIEGTHVDHLAPIWGTDWVNLAGLPAIAVPAGLSDEGLPIGVQVVGRPFSEPLLFAVARVLEQGLDGFCRPPLD
jgi:Asp-tRNA(Asn)/Glu-tRNA(Gln) amidotransferase A subunit family amidase